MPKYWPSYANNLGIAFTEKFWGEYGFIINVLLASPVGSHEYLFAFDLLDMMASDADLTEKTMLGKMFAISSPLPSVSKLEIANDDRYTGVETVGQFLERSHQF